MLGGSAWFLTEADRAFDVINAQMSQHGSGHGYPMVVDEYQPGYDWFHQGEGNYLVYMLAWPIRRMRATSNAPVALPCISPDRIRTCPTTNRPAPYPLRAQRQ